MPKRRGTRLGVRSGRTIKWNPVDERAVSSGYGYITKRTRSSNPNGPPLSEQLDMEDGNLSESFSAGRRRWQRHNADDISSCGIEFSLNKCRRWELPDNLKERIHDCRSSSGWDRSAMRIELVERHDVDRAMANRTGRQYVTAVYDTHSNSSGSQSDRTARHCYSNYRDLRQEHEETDFPSAHYIVSYSWRQGHYPTFSEKARRSFKYSRKIGGHLGRQKRQQLCEMDILEWETMTASESIYGMSDWQQEDDCEVIEHHGDYENAEDESDDETVTFSEYQKLDVVIAKFANTTASKSGRSGVVNPAMSDQVIMHGKGTSITVVPENPADCDIHNDVSEQADVNDSDYAIRTDSLRQFSRPETVSLNVCTKSVDDVFVGRYKGDGYYIVTSGSWPRRISAILPQSNEVSSVAVVLTISNYSSPVLSVDVAIHSDSLSLREQLYRRLEVLANECVTLTIPRIISDLFDISNQHNDESDDHDHRQRTIIDPSDISNFKRKKSLHSADFMCKVAGSDVQLVSPSSALKSAAILLYASEEQTNRTPTKGCNFPLECPICWEDFHETTSTWCEVTSLSNCSHAVCNSCLMLHIASCSQEGFTIVPCPVYQCNHVIDLSTVLSLMPPALWPKYNSCLHYSVLQTSPNWQWCPSDKCTMAVYSPAPDNVAGVSCSCGHVWCFKCGETVHWPANCQQAESFRQEAGNSTQDPDWLVIVQVKKCPNCHQPMEKNGGCQHMSCRCGHHFCWECLGDWLAHGTTLKCPQGKRNLLNIELSGGDEVGPGTRYYKDALLHFRQANTSALLKRQRKFKGCVKALLANALRRQRSSHCGVKQKVQDFVDSSSVSIAVDCCDEELNDSGVSDLSQPEDTRDCSEKSSPATDLPNIAGFAPELLAVLADHQETTDIIWSAAQFCQEAHTVLAFVAVTQYKCVKKRRSKKISVFVDKLEFILKSLENTTELCQTARNGTLSGNVKKLETFVNSGMSCLRQVVNCVLQQK